MKHNCIKRFSNITFSLGIALFITGCDNSDGDGAKTETPVTPLDESVINNFLLNVQTDTGTLNESSSLLSLEVRPASLSIRSTQYTYTLDSSLAGVSVYTLSGGDLTGSATGRLSLTDSNRSWEWSDSLGRNLTGFYSPITR